MSNLKRFLAMTLVLVMMIGSLAITASASAKFDDIALLKDTGLSKAVDLLAELGVARGTADNTFAPTDNVTREQFAMFTARIHSGTPEYFILTDEARAKIRPEDETEFSDVNGKDALWYMPINYCYEAGFITGMKAPSAEGAKDGTFGLGSTIIFQDAITMLVRSLGYNNSGLTYPVGFLAKAREIGLLDGFDGYLTNMRAQDVVTRADMARLLYNYFMSDFFSTEIVYNSLTRSYVNADTYRPVAGRFGITKVEGYITSIEGASLPMWVENPYAARIIGAGGSVLDSNWVQIGLNDPISMRNAAAKPENGGYDIVVSWVTPDVKTTTTFGNTSEVAGWIVDSSGAQIQIYMNRTTTQSGNVVGHLRTTKEALGLDKDYAGLAGSRSLLGVKIITYLGTKDYSINIPTEVIGTSSRTTSWNVPGSILDDADRNHILDSIELTTEDGAKHTFTQYNNRTFGNSAATVDNMADGDIGQWREDEGDINRFTGYVFAGDGSAKAQQVFTNRLSRWSNNNSADGSGESVRNLWYLAQIMKAAGSSLTGTMMDVDVVDNGYNRDGTRNRYVIFTPYTAGYITSDSNDVWSITRANGTSWSIRRGVSSIVQVVNKDTFAVSNPSSTTAYYFSNQGEYVLRGDALVQLTSDSTLATVTHTTSTAANFAIGVANSGNPGSFGNITIDFASNGVYYRTLQQRRGSAAGTDGNYIGTAGGTGRFSNEYAIGINDRYRIFSIKPENFNYGFVGANTGAFFIYKETTATQPDTNKKYAYVLSVTGSTQYNNGVLSTVYTVLDDKGQQKTIVDVNSSIAQYPQGSHIAYYDQGLTQGNTVSHRIVGAFNPYQVNPKEAGLSRLILPTDGNTPLTSNVTQTPQQSNNYSGNTMSWEVGWAVSTPTSTMTDMMTYNTFTGEIAVGSVTSVATYSNYVPASYQSTTAVYGSFSTPWTTVPFSNNLTNRDPSLTPPAPYVQNQMLPATSKTIVSSTVAGVAAQAEIANTSMSDIKLNSVLTANIPIFIYDYNNPSKANLLNRATFNTMWLQLSGTNTLRSAVLVKEVTMIGQIAGSAKVLYLGFDGTNPIVDGYLKAVTNSSNYLVVRNVTNVTFTFNGVNYRVVKAWDAITGAEADYAVSATGSNYTEPFIGQVAYKSSSRVTPNGSTWYDVLQSSQNVDNNVVVTPAQNLLDMTYVSTYVIGNPDYRATDYKPGQWVTLQNGNSLSLLGTSVDVTFINLTSSPLRVSNNDQVGLRRNSANTADAYDGETTSAIHVKSQYWNGFNSIRRSATDGELSGLDNWKRNTAGTWYAVPVRNYDNSIASLTLIYVN